MMSTWDSTQIRVASYKGVEFPCIVGTSQQRAKRYRLVEHTNRPGGLAWDGARKSVQIELTAVFGIDKISGLPSKAFDVNWRKQAEDLIKACDSIGPGTLVHPVYGEIWALAVNYPDDINGDAPNQIRMRLTFVECSQNKNAWNRMIQVLSPDARAELLASNLDLLLGFSGSQSFSFHVSSFLSMLQVPQLTVALMEATLAQSVAGILALAQSIDIVTNPAYIDYVNEAGRLTALLVETSDLQTGHLASLKTYYISRTMTLSDVAAEAGCSTDDVLRYNSIGDPLEIAPGQYLIVPA